MFQEMFCGCLSESHMAAGIGASTNYLHQWFSAMYVCVWGGGAAQISLMVTVGK